MEDGKRAFPLVVHDASRCQHIEAGLSIRQYYKAAVLPALIAKAELSTLANDQYVRAQLVRLSGALAEAMIAEDEGHAKSDNN